ncbi:MAG: WecB/TagA/CpsF family glycosyltransferase [Candidatus Pacearchaeota archaeon]
MKEKILFEKKTKEELAEFINKNKERKIINFLDAHTIFHSANNKSFKKCFTNKNSINCIDGFPISFFLSIKSMKRIPRNRGPTFTRYFLNSEYSKNAKHFFIGLSEKDHKLLKSKLPHLKYTYCYNPPYIKDIRFPESEINNMASKINKVNPDYVWVGIGSPKQNILSRELFETKAKYFINIGAALDFLLGKKEEAPLFIREMGIEWFYRLIKDFKYSYKKVLRAFIAMRYLNTIDIVDNKKFTYNF